MFEFNKIDRLGVLSISKPPANSYDIHFFEMLIQVLERIEQDDQLSTILIKSALPKFFCAGADIKVFGANTVEQNKAMVVMANRVAEKISKSAKIFIAFLNGHTLGGGLELAMACDIRLASDKSFLLGLPEVKLGLMPGNGGVPRLIYLIGAARAFELIISGTTITPQEAYQYGLINKLFDTNQAEQMAMEYAQNLSKGPKLAMATIKQTFNEGIGKSIEEFLQLETKKVDTLYHSNDAKEGFLAFQEKRDPRFL